MNDQQKNSPLQGLYHLNHRFGPGIMAYPDGCMDVGLWIGKYLYKLCDAAADSFTLKNFPEYAAYMDSGTTIKVQDSCHCKELLNTTIVLLSLLVVLDLYSICVTANELKTDLMHSPHYTVGFGQKSAFR